MLVARNNRTRNTRTVEYGDSSRFPAGGITSGQRIADDPLPDHTFQHACLVRSIGYR